MTKKIAFRSQKLLVMSRKKITQWLLKFTNNLLKYLRCYLRNRCLKKVTPWNFKSWNSSESFLIWSLLKIEKLWVNFTWLLIILTKHYHIKLSTLSLPLLVLFYHWNFTQWLMRIWQENNKNLKAFSWLEAWAYFVEERLKVEP